MKTIIGKFVVFALAVLTIWVGVGHAQITNQLDFKMSQPFTVANTTFDPGSYIIRPVVGTEQAVLLIMSATGKQSVMVDVEADQPDSAQASHLSFNKYKNVLALSQVFPGGGNTGYQLVQGHPEQLAAKTEKPTPQTVASTSK